MRIFVSGSLAHDRIMNYSGLFAENILPDKIHDINVSFYVESMQESFGGTAGNIAYSLALLGEQVVILASAGNDFDAYQKWLTEHHVDTGRIRLDGKLRTAFANIMTDQKDNQISAFYPGAMQGPYHFKDDSFDANGFVVIAPGNPVDMQTLPGLCRAKKVPFLFDPAQQIPILSDEDLKNGIEGSRVTVSNDYELALIIKKTGWSEEDILTHTEMLVTTYGDQGSRVRIKNTTVKVQAAEPKNTSDPTGAGDAYRAGFVHGLLKEWPLEIVAKFAGLIACYTVEKKGTQTHTFNDVSLRARYKENFNEDLPQ